VGPLRPFGAKRPKPLSPFRRFLIANGITPLRNTPSQYLYLGRLCSQQDSILAFCQRHGIQNVIWLSGDSHTSAINDDKNAGFPELMAGNLRQTNSRLAWLMANAGPLTSTFCPQANLSQSFALWNASGQGLGNTNFNNAYGRIDVFGQDSVRLSLVDTAGIAIANLTLPNSSSSALSTIARRTPSSLIAIS
jgi:hypothetical protein